jgi:RNA polymerase sigma-70 factor (ECF subfamily)
MKVTASEPTAPRLPAEGELARFVQEEADVLYGIFRRSVRDPEAASDLLQDTLLSAWKSMPRYDPARPIRGWMVQIGLNRLRNFLRRSRLEREVEATLPAPDADGAPSPIDALLEREGRDLIEKAVKELPERQRAAVILRYQWDYSCREIGRALDMTENAVSLHLHRAREALRRSLGKHFEGENP